MTKKHYKNAVRKDEILRAALSLAITRGYQNVTRVHIADFIGVAPTTVQYHFGTMGQLRKDLMRHAVKQKNLIVIGQGLAARDKRALDAPRELQDAAWEKLRQPRS